jgi:glutamate/tyrosine decarboxylase-like PLP-dependent enzyme
MNNFIINKNKYQEAIKDVNNLIKKDVPVDNGRLFGYVYSLGEEHDKLLKEISNKFIHATGLDHNAFPSAAIMENHVINWSKKLLNCPESGSGSITSGGTESIMMAIKSIRDKNKSNPNINIIIPMSAHPAFIKSCNYLKVTYKVADVNPITYKSVPGIMEVLIDENTVAIVGSAPSYGIGVIDPIKELGVLAEQYNIDLIVDACVGGGILPFLELGNLFDFTIPGVSIITLDFHKYFYSAKGCSAVMYRNKDMLNYQVWSYGRWIGYSIVNSTMQNTKSISSLATMYVNSKIIDYEGYRNIVKLVMNAKRRFIELFSESDIVKSNLYIISNPDVNIMSIASKTLDIFKLSEIIRSKGWFIQAQYSYFNIPSSFHISIGYQNINNIENFINILSISVQECIKNNHFYIESDKYLDVKSRDNKLRSDLINNLTNKGIYND